MNSISLQQKNYTDYYEVEKSSTTMKVITLITALVLTGTLTLAIITLSSNLISRLTLHERIPIGIVVLPNNLFLLTGTLMVLNLAWSRKATERDSFGNTLTDDEVNTIKKSRSLDEVVRLLSREPPKSCCVARSLGGIRKTANLGEQVRKGKLTPESVFTLNHFFARYLHLVKEIDNAPSNDLKYSLNEELQTLKAEWARGQF